MTGAPQEHRITITVTRSKKWPELAYTRDSSDCSLNARENIFLLRVSSSAFLFTFFWSVRAKFFAATQNRIRAMRQQFWDLSPKPRNGNKLNATTKRGTGLPVYNYTYLSVGHPFIPCRSQDALNDNYRGNKPSRRAAPRINRSTVHTSAISSKYDYLACFEAYFFSRSLAARVSINQHFNYAVQSQTGGCR